MFDEGAAEIVTYNADDKLLYFTNADANTITILDMSNPASLTKVGDIDCAPYGEGINSVAYYGGYLAAAIEGESAGTPGAVVFFDDNGGYVSSVTVGFLPDMVTFSPNGANVLAACEGEPSSDYKVDPKGSVSIIDISRGIASVTQANVTDLTFDNFQATLPAGVRVFGPMWSLADDFEFTDDSLKRYQIVDYGSFDTLLFQDFEDLVNGLQPFDTASYASNRNWTHKSFSGNYFAEANGYGGNAGCNDWMVSPAFSNAGYDAMWLSFQYVKRFNGDGLKVMVSIDYTGDGNPSAATWADVTDRIKWSDGANYNIHQSGTVDITALSGPNTYVAFVYVTPGGASGDGSLYQIDNVLVRGIKPYQGMGWYYDSYSGDHFAEANGFSGKEATNSWLILPQMDLPHFHEAYFSFTSAKNYSGGSLNILISNNYDGGSDPASFSWDTLTAMATLSAGSFAKTASGDLDISNWAGQPFYLAFHYTGMPGAGGSTNWQFDNFRVGAKTLSVAHNMEPEYVSVSEDSKTAYVTCQENNALVTIDLITKTIITIAPLGYKDHNTEGNGMDVSDKDKAINIGKWPVRGLYMPDAIAAKSIGGKNYLFSANEGDARDYWFDVDSESECYFLGGADYDDGECMAYSEEYRAEDLDLDDTAFPDESTLLESKNLGRLALTSATGDVDGDGDMDELYSFGARSFSIWDPATTNLVYDSGDDFEQITAKLIPDGFNANNDENGAESRSDNKGPEPEAVALGEYRDSVYAFVGLERTGGVMVYNVSDPAKSRFIAYTNNRDFSDTVDMEKPWAGDLGPECVLFVEGDKVSEHFVVVANEVSGSVSVYSFGDRPISTKVLETSKEWTVYPNPSATGVLRATKADTYGVFDLGGRMVKQVPFGQVIDLSDLEAGSYLLRDSMGVSKVILKQ
ncbi:MAG: choice-of-anchor I family protein [Bacteroidetes bacterium]|nr:choice-of-anchor I family protein [Bacteroidota bacterium]